jgi:hypothetical protein
VMLRHLLTTSNALIVYQRHKGAFESKNKLDQKDSSQTRQTLLK